ncbi:MULTISPECIES: hypothetical protein [unclassified Streptomyces]|uniref:hypothetical protein n=1 Tax=unclassified Streptomyces TaxID=2593676 RepID=UPI001F46B0F1|nr:MULTISPECIES: hypothetical protein [unclassified Streptomyces]MCF0086583.1 hypothetical protein [Streptomyces sp. MH192]MCF0098737.1 hypothetical protein [Streptomyces sp. MH191]
MALTASVQAWLISKVGTTTPTSDLEARYTRLGTARAVAIEILNERLADLRAQATTIGVSGVVNVSFVENIKAYEREIALLESGSSPAPDDPAVTEDSDTAVGQFYLRERARR